MSAPSPSVTPGLGALQSYLACAVPLLIDEIVERGGPFTRDYVRLFQFEEAFMVFGADNMMFPDRHDARDTREGGRLWGEMAFACAVMAFQPGGITFAGNHFSAGKADSTGKRVYAGIFAMTQKHLDVLWDNDLDVQIQIAFTAAAEKVRKR